MEIISIQIQNFKSIKDVTIPLKEYNETNKSKTTFLVGLNESGKSAILDAINILEVGFDDIDYSTYCHLSEQDSEEYIDIYAELSIKNDEVLSKAISEESQLPESIVKKIKIKSLRKNIYKKTGTSNSLYKVKINDLELHEYLIETSTTTLATTNKQVQKESIKELSTANNIAEKITKANAQSFLKENQKLLTIEKLEFWISNKMKAYFDSIFPKIQMWKPIPKYLINETVSLSEFSKNPNICIPLKNMFHIFGKSTNTEIKETIEKALKSQARIDELRDKLSSEVTKHLNKVWKEHKVKLKLSINGDDCEVHVEDKDKSYSYFKMNQRSDGFKQFVSLILSLSAQNESNNLVDNIILIDEPEVHLHPSGIKYMRDELLKIGKKNHVFVATHSQYMIDTNCPERHWIVKKEKSETDIKQIDENTPLEDDIVLSSAFGLNSFKELLADNILVVEGNDDKNILQNAIKKLKHKLSYSIKSARGASKAPGFASLLNDEAIYSFILFDDDKEGRDNKKRILDEVKGSFTQKNVFTLKDIKHDLPKDCTIEDLLPIKFVKDFFETELNATFTLDSNTPLVLQLKNQSPTLKENKAKLDSLKYKLSEEFIRVYNSKEKIECDAPILTNFIGELINKVEKVVD